MTEPNTELKTPIYSTMKYISTEESPHPMPKTQCPTHGPSQAPLLEREFQKPQSQEIIKNLLTALNDLADQDQCLRCTVESISTLLTTHVREIREAKRNGEWTKERKAMKAEFKAVFKPMKKDIKALWKGIRTLVI